MKPVYWNIFSVLIGIFLLSGLPLLFSVGMSELNTDNFSKIAIPLTIGIFGFVIMSGIKIFTWHKKAVAAFVILSFISTVILFYLSISLNAVEENYGIDKKAASVESPLAIKDSFYHELISEMKPDVSLSGVAEKQLRKASKYYSYNYVFPILPGNSSDSIRIFFACKTNNGMMGVALESYKEILTEGTRYLKLANDPLYFEAVNNFKKENKMAVSSKYLIYEVTDPDRLKGFLNQYLWLSMSVFNGIYIFLLLLLNLKIDKDKSVEFD